MLSKLKFIAFAKLFQITLSDMPGKCVVLHSQLFKTAESEKYRKTDLQSVGLVLKLSQWASLGRPKPRACSIRGSQVEGRDLSTWTIFCYFRKNMNSELEQKQSSKEFPKLT